MTVKGIYIALIFTFSVGHQIDAQISPAIEKQLKVNIEGFELNKFLQESTQLKPEFIIERLMEYNLNSECNMSYKILKTELIYPSKNYVTVGIKKEGIECGEVVKVKTPNWEDRYLIAIDTSKNKDNVKFVSGEMFLDNISKDFKLDAKNPNTYHNYLRLKLFNIEAGEIKYLKSIGNKLYYSVISKLYDKEIEISINIKGGINKIEYEEK